MSRTYDLDLQGADGQTVYCAVHEPEDVKAARGVLLIAHGLKGYKDYGLFPQLAARAAGAGYVATRFNFSHSGMTRNIETFERLDLFEQDTWGRQVEDLLVVSGAMDRAYGRPQAWFGHSRGGGSVLLAAAKKQPACVIGAASVSVCDRYTEADKAAMKRDGRVSMVSSRTGQTLYCGRAMLDEIEADPASYEPTRAIASLTCPVLLVHGTADATVVPAEAEALKAAQPDAELVWIEGASHTFDTPNPLPEDAEPPIATAAMYDATLAFMGRVMPG